jgi:hypothetical protein
MLPGSWCSEALAGSECPSWPNPNVPHGISPDIHVALHGRRVRGCRSGGRLRCMTPLNTSCPPAHYLILSARQGDHPVSLPEAVLTVWSGASRPDAFTISADSVPQAGCKSNSAYSKEHSPESYAVRVDGRKVG